MIAPDYAGRFALFDESSADAVQAPTNWILRESGRLRLASDQQLPVLDIVSHNGRKIGWLLGYPIDPSDQTLLGGSLKLSINGNDSDEVERELYRLGGRFAAVVVTEKWKRYYPDAAGSLAAFLSSQRHVIASTPTLLRDLVPVDPKLVTALRRAVEASGTWFPVGMSGYSDVTVALPNHHVDLETWTSHRHWPRAAAPLVSPRLAKQVVHEIFDDLRGTIAAVAKQHPIVMDLTGGHDSRMLLAAALPFVSTIEFRTNPDYSTGDSLLAEGLSDVFGLEHNNPSIDYGSRVLLRGYGGEVGRCFYWQKCPGDAQQPTAAELLQGFGYPDPHETMLAEADRWLAALPKLDRAAILDLAYIEQRLGTTMSHVLYNSDTKNLFAMFPLNHRRIYQCMMSLPHEFRRQQSLATEMNRLGSPLLNLFPINAPHFVGLTKYQKYCGYLWRRRLMNGGQRAIVRGYCTRGRTLPRMISEDLSHGPMRAIRRLRSARTVAVATGARADRQSEVTTR